MITILSGSPRKNSNTLKVAKAIRNTIKRRQYSGEIRIIDFNDFDIPSASKGVIRVDTLSEWQSYLYNSCCESELVFILTPEYNWFPSAEIIQMIHCMASMPFREMWNEKVFATCGTSNGRGGRMPAVQLSYTLNKILNVLNCESMVSPKMFESQFTDKVLDSEGNSLGSDEYMKGLEIFVDYNLNAALRWKRGS